MVRVYRLQAQGNESRGDGVGACTKVAGARQSGAGRSKLRIRRLTQNFLNHLSMHIRKPAVNAIVTKCQLLMVYAEQV